MWHLFPTGLTAPGIQTAPAHDPRGGVWVWAELDHRLIRFDERTGQPFDSINIATLTGDPNATPSSTIDIATNNGRPIMFIGVWAGPGSPIWLPRSI